MGFTFAAAHGQKDDATNMKMSKCQTFDKSMMHV